MVGKLNLDLGEDYAFDIRRAREVAEGGAAGGAQQAFVRGPYVNPDQPAVPFFIQRTVAAEWFVWFDIDADPDPDIKRDLRQFLADAGVTPSLRSAVEVKARRNGWNGVD